MDVLSHALLGYILGQSLQLDSNLQLVLVISSIILDIDATSVRSREAAIRSHRGLLHSLLAAILASLLVGIGYNVFMRLPAASLVLLLPICLTGFLSHLLLDLLTTGNMTVLWPLSRKNFALNLTHYIDPMFLGVLLSASLLITYLKKDVNMIQAVTVAAFTILSAILGARYYEKKLSTRIVKGLVAGVTSKVATLPTIRPGRWWVVSKTPFDNGYRYEIYSVDSVHKTILRKNNVESAYINYSGPTEPPIDSPQKAVACSKRDRRIAASIRKFVTPAVNATPSLNGNAWQVFWYDAVTYMNRRERRGILARVKIDGTVTVSSGDAHDSNFTSSAAQKQPVE